MNKKYILYLFLAIPAFIMQTESCKKREANIYNVEQYLKDWMFFDTGTWWVYKELNSNLIDSQFVTKSELNYFEIDRIKKSEYYREQSAFVYINKDYFFYLASPKGSSGIEKRKTGDGGKTNMLFNPLEVGQRKSSSGGLGYTEIQQVDQHYTLDNIKYDTLITLLENYDGTENGDSVEYKVFKGVGIINKKNITKKEEWKLIKYHINLNKQ